MSSDDLSMKIPGLYSAITEVLESHFVEELESYLSEDEFGRTDRKSTRLNSSHKPISYAVFCLKKKKKTKEKQVMM